MVNELAIYVHGVSLQGQGSHQKQYRALHSAIRKRCKDFPADFCGVEWGWHEKGAVNPTSQQLLSDAEDSLGPAAIRAVDDPSDFTLNPLRVAVNKFRSLMIYGFSDMFYYVSEDGKSAVRYAMARQIVEHVQKTPTWQSDPLSLTLLGHSAGSIAVFDFLFYLFHPERQVAEFIHPEKAAAAAAAMAPDDPAGHVDDTMNQLVILKDMAQGGRLRIRRLFTFGSPITPLAFRSDPVLGVLAAGKRLSCVDYGLTRDDAAFGSALKGPRWVNLWDKDDPIAWPVQPLMAEGGTVAVDKYVDVSDDPTNAHTAYWEDEDFQQAVAEAW